MNLSSYLTIPVVMLAFIGIAKGEFPGLQMNRATIAFVAAVILVGLQIISPSAALHAIDPSTLVLLFAMMIISAHLRMAGFFNWLSSFVMRRLQSSYGLLAYVILFTGLLSALFLNDIVAVMFTPLVLNLTRQLRRNPFPYLIGLAASANIGSAATITGNPQNILIGLSSHITFAEFLVRLGPIALIGLILTWIILVRLYRTEFEQAWPVNETIRSNPEIDWGLLRKCMVLTTIMLVAFLAGLSMPLVAIFIAATLFISRRVQPDGVFAQIDWSLLILFVGLFIVTAALEDTDALTRTLLLLKPWADSGITQLALITALLSNLVSNVPAVLLLRSVVVQLIDPTRGWLVLAMASTLAGNLTLLGSVVNLIVAEAARAQGVKLTFGEYLRAGIPITLTTVLAGILWLSLSA